MIDRREAGAATLEVVVLGLVLIVPLIWLLGVLAAMHSAALATDAAVREVGWEVVHHGTRESIDAAASGAFADHGLDPTQAEVRWDGSTERGEVVTVTAMFPIKVASFPLLGSIAGPSIDVRAVHRVRVPSFRSET